MILLANNASVGFGQTVYASKGVVQKSTKILVPHKELTTTTQNTSPLVKDERIERIIAQGEKMKERLDTAITRLTRITDRLDSRISKLETSGINLLASKTAAAQVRIELEHARKTSDTITPTFTMLRASGTAPRPAFTFMKDALTQTELAIKSAHKELVYTITTVKPSENTNTTTTSTH
jgi:hypothetical protein